MQRQPKRVLGYARVSSAEQALGTSLQDQQNVIHAHAQARGLKVTKMYVEAESAVHEKAERREQVLALMADLRADDLVLVDKIDRWSRDPEFCYGSVRTILAAGAHFFAIGDDCDPSTAAGDSMLGLRIFFAREEHKRIKIRMVGTRKILRDRGYYVEGLPPWGYKRQDVKGAERNALLVDPERAKIVRDIFRRCIGGESLSEIVEATDITRDIVAQVLGSRVYLGEIRDSNKQWIKGRHAAIIDPRTFVLAVQSLDRRRNGCRPSRDGSETSDWWLRDLARCALCDAKMSAAYAGPKDARRYYFACCHKCTPRYVPVRKAEEECLPMFADRLVHLREMIAAAGAAPVVVKKPARSVEELRERLAKKRARFLEMYADGTTTRDEMREALARVDAERLKLDAAAYEPPPVSTEERRSALREIVNVIRVWKNVTPVERRALAATIARAVMLAAGMTPKAEWFSSEDIARHKH